MTKAQDYVMMGDIADSLIEAGLDALARHHAGNCEDDCEYCDEEDELSEPKEKL